MAVPTYTSCQTCGMPLPAGAGVYTGWCGNIECLPEAIATGRVRRFYIATEYASATAGEITDFTDGTVAFNNKLNLVGKDTENNNGTVTDPT